MELDSTTIIASAAPVAGLSGLFLMFAGGNLKAIRPTTIWGVSNIFTAFGMMLILQGGSYDLAFLAMISAAALTWVAVARFNAAEIQLPFLVAGLTVWVVLALGPWEISFGIRAASYLAIAFCFSLATAVELWRTRSEHLPSRVPVLILVVINALAAAIGAAALAGLPLPPVVPPGGATWVVYVSTVVFTIGTAVFFLAMAKERKVAEHQHAALTDSLTGLANRAALMAKGADAIAEAKASNSPIAVALFDLDHFKVINDTFGHRTGDVVLQRFADSARSSVRSNDLFGRVGGEEFLALIPGATGEAALAFADRVRAAFAADSVWVDGKPVRSTVSSGVAVIEPGDEVRSLDDLLDRADAALYDAKASGRDRVSLGGIAADEPAQKVFRRQPRAVTASAGHAVVR